jgi:hypothetical protein
MQPGLHETREQDREDDGVRADRNPDAVHPGETSRFRAISDDHPVKR